MRGDRDRPKMHRFSCVYHVKFCDRSLCQQNLAHDGFEHDMSRRLKEANAALLKAQGYTYPITFAPCLHAFHLACPMPVHSPSCSRSYQGNSVSDRIERDRPWPGASSGIFWLMEGEV